MCLGVSEPLASVALDVRAAPPLVRFCTDTLCVDTHVLAKLGFPFGLHVGLLPLCPSHPSTRTKKSTCASSSLHARLRRGVARVRLHSPEPNGPVLVQTRKQSKNCATVVFPK